MSRVPHDAVAERALVSALLGGQIDMDSLIGQIADADFYVPANRATFQAMLSLHEAQRAIDMVTVIGELTRLGTLEVAGGASAIGGMQAVDGANPDEYARQVRDCSQLRRLVDVAEEIRVRAGHGASPGSIVSYAEEEILKITVGRDRGEPVLAGELLARVLGEIEAACKTRNPVTGLATGFTDVDNYLGGLQPADLVIVGGRPSMGKTAFGMNIAVNAARAYRAERQPDGTIKAVEGAVVGLGAAGRCDRARTDGRPGRHDVRLRTGRSRYRPGHRQRCAGCDPR